MNSSVLRIFILFSLFVMLFANLDWRDCVDEFKSTNRAITISQFDAPTHINFPGLVHYTLNMTFERNISSVYVDFHITRYFFGLPISLPCKGPTIIGTCTDIDMCWMLNRTLGYMPNHPDSYGQKIETIFNRTTGHYLSCPIQRENIFVEDQVLELAEIAPYLHLLADGDYTIKVIARENTTGPVIGCIQVNATIGGQDGTPSLVG